MHKLLNINLNATLERNYNYVFIYLLYTLLCFVIIMTFAIDIIFSGIHIIEKVFDGASKNKYGYLHYHLYHYCYRKTFSTFIEDTFYIFHFHK